MVNSAGLGLTFWFLCALLLLAVVVDPALAARRRTRFPTRRPTPAPRKLALMIPAYFYPASQGLTHWNKMTQLAGRGVNITAIMNVNNGPGDGVNSDYLAVVNAYKAKGGRLLGYIYSCYGRDLCVVPEETRNVSQMVSDALRYDALYGPLHGIFVDELSDRLEEYDFYRNFTTEVRRVKPDWILMANPGIPCPEQYLDLFNILLTREGGPNAVINAPTWAMNYSPTRQSYLYYGVRTESAMRTKVREARSRNVGYIYVTDDVLPNPWDKLPGYIEQLVSALAQ